jgi:hypothetical protein
MNYYRLFNLFIALALLAAIVLTVQEAAATANVLSGNGNASRCANLPARHSIHNEYDSHRGAWVIVSEDGPTGLDGGLVQLLSDYRTCAK